MRCLFSLLEINSIICKLTSRNTSEAHIYARDWKQSDGQGLLNEFFHELFEMISFTQFAIRHKMRCRLKMLISWKLFSLFSTSLTRCKMMRFKTMNEGKRPGKYKLNWNRNSPTFNIILLLLKSRKNHKHANLFVYVLPFCGLLRRDAIICNYNFKLGTVELAPWSVGHMILILFANFGPLRSNCCSLC